jgi:hypothetical protein
MISALAMAAAGQSAVTVHSDNGRCRSGNARCQPDSDDFHLGNDSFPLDIGHFPPGIVGVHDGQ